MHEYISSRRILEIRGAHDDYSKLIKLDAVFDTEEGEGRGWGCHTFVGSRKNNAAKTQRKCRFSGRRIRERVCESGSKTRSAHGYGQGGVN